MGTAETLPCLVRIARDRIMIVSDLPVAVEEGWNDGGWAATDVGDAYRVLELTGPAAPEIVREGSAADLDAGSLSAAVRFAAIVGVLLWRGPGGTVRLHVERGLAPHLWRWLEARAG